MRDMVFLYKADSDDRDCCAYISAKPMRWECGHYFGSVNLEGSCYSGSTWANYDEIKTVLSEVEYEQLKQFSSDICALGVSIKEGDERYLKGVALCEAIQPVYDKLLSEENRKFFEEIVEEEKEYLMDEHNLDEDDIEYIFDNYGLPYRDRSVVSCVFADVADCGAEEAYEYEFISKNSVVERFFDFEAFGEALVDEDERYVLLPDGRVVYLNY